MTDSTRVPAAGNVPPYYVWLGMRILGLAGAVMVLGAIWGLLNGSLSVTWAILIGTTGALLGGGRRTGINSDQDVPVFCEILGSLLSPKGCPECGQSIFDQMPTTGFELETARHSFWPSRICYGCGSDTTKLAPSRQNAQDDIFGS